MKLVGLEKNIEIFGQPTAPGSAWRGTRRQEASLGSLYTGERPGCPERRRCVVRAGTAACGRGGPGTTVTFSR